MTDHQLILLSLFGAIFILLLWGRIRYDLVAFSALVIGVLTGAVPTSDAFSGFGHPATIIVALVLVVSAGLVRSGAVYLITKTFVDASRPLSIHIGFMGIIGAVMSAFMNNVAALALLLPVDLQTAKKAKRAAALSLDCGAQACCCSSVVKAPARTARATHGHAAALRCKHEGLWLCAFAVELLPLYPSPPRLYFCSVRFDMPVSGAAATALTPMPFRLTRNLMHFVAPFGVEGAFSGAFSHSQTMVRDFFLPFGSALPLPVAPRAPPAE